VNCAKFSNFDRFLQSKICKQCLQTDLASARWITDHSQFGLSCYYKWAPEVRNVGLLTADVNHELPPNITRQPALIFPTS